MKQIALLFNCFLRRILIVSFNIFGLLISAPPSRPFSRHIYRSLFIHLYIVLVNEVFNIPYTSIFHAAADVEEIL